MKNNIYLNVSKPSCLKFLFVFIYISTLSMSSMASDEKPKPCNNYDKADDSINEVCSLYNSNKKLAIRNKDDGQIILFKIIEKRIGDTMLHTRIPISLIKHFKNKNKTNDVAHEKDIKKEWETKIHFDLDAGFFNNDKGVYNEQYIAINGDFNKFSMMLVFVFTC